MGPHAAATGLPERGTISASLKRPIRSVGQTEGRGCTSAVRKAPRPRARRFAAVQSLNRAADG